MIYNNTNIRAMLRNLFTQIWDEYEAECVHRVLGLYFYHIEAANTTRDITSDVTRDII